MRMRKGTIAALLTAALALSAVFAMGVGAYFSDYEIAHGDVILQLGDQTEINEEVYEGNKTISIKNTGEATSVVRVAVFGGELMTVTAASDWEQHGDYYYYKKVLAPGESTSQIKAELKDLTKEQVEALGDDFDVVVTHESALAVYDENNKVIKPDAWDYLPDITVE